LEFLRDPAWGFTSVIVAIILAGIGIIVTLWLRNRKGLSYQVLSSAPLVTVSRNAQGEVTQDLEIRYKGQPVRDLHVVEVRVWNSGNQPILETEFANPLEFAFGGQHLSSGIIEAPDSVDKNSLIQGSGSGPESSAVALNPLLLNQKDSLTLQAVLTDFDGTVDVRARIVGVSQIRRVGSSDERTRRVSLLASVLALLTSVAAAAITLILFLRDKLTPSLFNFILIAGALVISTTVVSIVAQIMRPRQHAQD
jgi:hypothetical protein